MTSFSVYPNAIDGYSQINVVRDGIDEIVAKHHNSLRDAVVKIESELGTNPSGSFGTVADRLNSVGDASALIEAHIHATHDAHPASAISLADVGNNYVASDVEGAFAELASILPVSLNTIGNNNTSVPNSGVPDFVNKTGRLWSFNTSGSGNEVRKTQPITITGVQIVEIGDANGSGTGAQLTQVTFSPFVVNWTAPGDSPGANVDISSLTAGQTVILSSADTSKKVKIVRTSAVVNNLNSIHDTFDLYRFGAKTGAYSYTGTGIKDSSYIINTAVSPTSISHGQTAISGLVFPADKGTLVLQRKLKNSSDFFPIAVLDLEVNFNETLRADEQLTYFPSLAQFDVITLYDRLPARKDYENLELDTNGNPVYTNFNISATYSPFQVAKYVIPLSNSPIVGGQLTSPASILATDINAAVGTYRVVHYHSGITDFNGEPSGDQIYSLQDPLGISDDGDNDIRASNVFLDDAALSPPAVASGFVLRPVVDAEITQKMISGIHYYNSADDLFDIEIASDGTLFDKTYVHTDILEFNPTIFTFPGGTQLAVENLMNDGYVVFSNSNLPNYTDRGFYLINSTHNTANRIYPSTDQFSTQTHISAHFNDPFGTGTSVDAYGALSSLPSTPLRILVNSYDGYSFSNAEIEEHFIDETYRVGQDENFTFALNTNQFTGTGTNGTLDAWDSTVAIDNNAHTSDALQVGGRFSADGNFAGLIFPQDDYTTTNVRPTQSGSVNYSGFGTVDRYYQRIFSTSGAISSGVLTIKSSGSSLITWDNLAFSNASRCMKIEIKIPGSSLNSTGWLDVGRPFGEGTSGLFGDGNGTMIDVIAPNDNELQITFSFGDRNNADTGNLIAIRVTYFHDQLAVANKKILSFLGIS